MIRSFLKKKHLQIGLFCLFIVALFFRIYGLTQNHPFWVDEFSTATQAQLYIEYGVRALFNPNINFEYNNYIYHLLTTIFFQLLGQSEFIARLPAVLIGSAVPILVFALGMRLFNKTTAISAALLTTFSYFEITWSRQARGYVVLQAITLLALFLYIDIIGRRKVSTLRWLGLVAVLVAGVLTHFFFYLLLVILATDYIVRHHRAITHKLRNPLLYASLGFVGYALFKLRLFHVLYETYSDGIFKSNNLWYYHSFLWREYSLIVFLALVGIIFSLSNRIRASYLPIWYMILHVLFLCFFLSPYVSRYTLPIFPLLLVYAGYAISQISSKSKYFLPIALTLLIIFNGDKFVIKPKQFYSVNHDFRELALVDYDRVYSIIVQKGKLNEGQTAIVDTWQDRMYWYVGDNYPALYMFRWINEPSLTNGLIKRTDYLLNSEGEKIIPRQKNLRFIGELKDLKQAVEKYPKGFIFIDDSSLPEDVIDYAEKNFKKELYLDHYPLDDNPYSIWPGTLYSWGIN